MKFVLDFTFISTALSVAVTLVNGFICCAARNLSVLVCQQHNQQYFSLGYFGEIFGLSTPQLANFSLDYFGLLATRLAASSLNYFGLLTAKQLLFLLNYFGESFCLPIRHSAHPQQVSIQEDLLIPKFASKSCFDAVAFLFLMVK